METGGRDTKPKLLGGRRVGGPSKLLAPLPDEQSGGIRHPQEKDPQRYLHMRVTHANGPPPRPRRKLPLQNSREPGGEGTTELGPGREDRETDGLPNMLLHEDRQLGGRILQETTLWRGRELRTDMETGLALTVGVLSATLRKNTIDVYKNGGATKCHYPSARCIIIVCIIKTFPSSPLSSFFRPDKGPTEIPLNRLIFSTHDGRRGA